MGTYGGPDPSASKEETSLKASLPPFTWDELPVLSPIKAPLLSSRQVTFVGNSSSTGKAPAIPKNLLELPSDAEIARMVKIKEEAFDEDGYFNPVWKNQFIPVPAPSQG